MKIDGSILIGVRDVTRNPRFASFDASSGAPLEKQFCEANEEDVAVACDLARSAFDSFSTLSPDKRASFLEAAADAIGDIGDILIDTAMAETGLPRGRLENERGRTTGQLRMFATELRRGEWLDVTIDEASPDRTPPRSDLRRMNIALGPVAVFGASNFPLAFSVAGGDTASAFASGCPVIVKGHPAHPGTGELVARAIRSAVTACGLHQGVFSFLPGTSNDLGAALVANPRIKAVGFTGSRSGGLALVDIASKRSEPIPVFAEMSSINPVVLLDGALADRAEELGAAFIASLALGAGQFCTNPGLIIAVDTPNLDRFISAAANALEDSAPQAMLTPTIQKKFAQGVAELERNFGARRVGSGAADPAGKRCSGALFETDAAIFMEDQTLSHEIFGVSAVIVRCINFEELTRLIQTLEGQLTASIQMSNSDHDQARLLLPLLQAKAGRVLANGWPTGVEVSHAMVHGGPYPATSDVRTTSVGTLSMGRYLRPVCYQDIPDDLLPKALQASNPWQLPRTINGVREL